MRRVIGWVLVSAVGVAAAPAASAAEPFASDDHQFKLDVPRQWRQQELAAPYTGEGVGEVARWWRDGDDRSAVVTRMDGPTRGAWRNDAHYYDAFEKGVRDQVKGYRRIKRKLHKLGRIPVLDLWYRAGDDAVAMRVLFFRRYALSLAVSFPHVELRKRRSATRKILTSFQPYFGD